MTTVEAPRKGHLYIDGLNEAKKKIEKYLLSQHKGLKPLSSSSRSKKYGCQGFKTDGSGCGFEVRLTKTKEGIWNTSFVNLAHNNCASALIASNAVIKDFLQSTIDIDPQVKSTVLKKCKADFGIQKSLRSINRVKNELKRTHDNDTSGSWNLLSIYLEVLTKKNPGTVTAIETLPTKHFHRLFVMLKSSVNVAVRSPKKMLMIDAFYLKGQRNGVCLTVTCSDANNQNVVVSFCVCPIENKSNYVWMFNKMKEDNAMRGLIEDQQLVIISDRDKGVVQAVSESMPEALHHYCLQHLLRNAPAVGPVGNKLVWSAAKARDEATFTRYMDKLREIRTFSYNYLMSEKQDKKLWSTYGCEEACFGQLTSNWTESTANWAGYDLRSASVFDLVDGLVVKTMEQFAIRCEALREQ